MFHSSLDNERTTWNKTKDNLPAYRDGVIGETFIYLVYTLIRLNRNQSGMS